MAQRLELPHTADPSMAWKGMAYAHACHHQTAMNMTSSHLAEVPCQRPSS